MDFPKTFSAAAENMKAAAANTSYTASIEAATNAICKTLRTGGKLLIFGNGGSAADAEHIAAELTGRFVRDRRALPAIALSTNTAALTAIANDMTYAHVFARQIEALGREGDLALGITTSGRSPNVLSALKYARDLKLTTVALTGPHHDELREYCDIVIAAPATDTPRIQELHLVTYHAICHEVERTLFD